MFCGDDKCQFEDLYFSLTIKKCADRSIPVLFENYDRPTKQPTTDMKGYQ